MSLAAFFANFTQPLFLIAFPVVLAFLLYIYRKTGPAKKVVIASTILLEQLTSFPSLKKRKWPPPRILFDLLLLSLLVLGLAGLLKKNTSEQVVILIDNSFSMRAKFSKNQQSVSLLELAREEARLALNREYQGKYRWNVFVTSPELASITGGYRSTAAALDSLKKIKTVFSADQLESALNKITSREEFAKLIVFSDKEVNLLDSRSSNDLSKIISVKIPKNQNLRLNNLAFNRAQLNLDPEQQKKSLQVSVKSYSSKDSQARLKLLDYSKLEEPRPIISKTLELKSLELRDVVFDIDSNKSLFKLELEELSTKGFNKDSILEDNTLWLSDSYQGGKIYVVSDYLKQDLNLASLSVYSVEVLSADQYQKVLKNQKEDVGAMIFHRLAPSTWPKTNTAFILPPIDNPLFEVFDPQEKADLTYWNSTHPLLSYINFSVLDFDRIHTFKKAFWSEKILGTNLGPIFLAGSFKGARRAFLGFELLPFLGRENRLNSVLFLNLLNWLESGGQNNQPYLSPYQSKSVASAIEKVSFFDGNSLSQKPGTTFSLSLKKFQADRPGLLFINDSKTYPVSYIDPSESNTYAQEAITFNPQGSKQEQKALGEKLAPFLALIAMILLVLEVVALFFNFRRQARVG